MEDRSQHSWRFVMLQPCQLKAILYRWSYIVYSIHIQFLIEPEVFWLFCWLWDCEIVRLHCIVLMMLMVVLIGYCSLAHTVSSVSPTHREVERTEVSRSWSPSVQQCLPSPRYPSRLDGTNTGQRESQTPPGSQTSHAKWRNCCFSDEIKYHWPDEKTSVIKDLPLKGCGEEEGVDTVDTIQ